jgi:hypothetical protein
VHDETRTGGVTAVAALAIGFSLMLTSVRLSGNVLLTMLLLVVGGTVAFRAESAFLRAVGGFGLVIGAVLIGGPLVDAVLPDQPLYRDDLADISVTKVLLATYLPVTAALAVLAARRSRTATIALGATAPALVMSVIAVDNRGPLTVVLWALGLGCAAVVWAVRCPASSRWAVLAHTSAAMFAAAAVGTAMSPLDVLGGSSVTEADGEAAVLSSAIRVTTLLIGSALALAVGFIAAARRDVPGAAFAVLALSPLPGPFPVSFTGVTSSWPELVPGAIVVGIGLLALRSPRAENIAGRLVRRLGASPPSRHAWLAAALTGVELMVIEIASFDVWTFRQQALLTGVLVLTLLAGAQFWLSGAPGAVVAVMALLSLAVFSPVQSLMLTERDRLGISITGAGIAGLVVGLFVSFVMLGRHPRPAVAASAAFVLVNDLAFAIRLLPPSIGFIQDEARDAAILFVPVAIVGLLAAIAAHRALRPSTVRSAQAAAAVALGIGGAVLVGIVLSVSASRDHVERLTSALPSAMASPLQSVGELEAPTLLGALLVLVTAAAVLSTLRQRVSGAIGAAAALVVFAGAPTLAVAALEVGDVGLLDRVVWAALAVTAALVASAVRWSRMLAGPSPLADAGSAMSDDAAIHEAPARHVEM